MTTKSTDPRDIEADLERERAALANTLDTLSDRVSVDNLAQEALGMLRSYSGSATVRLDHVVRANPFAVALIGAGVAWMFLGPRMRRSSSGSSDYGSGYESEGGTDYVGSESPSYGSSGSSYGSSSYGSAGYDSSGTGSSGYAGGLQGDDRGWASSGSSDYGRVGYVASDNDEDHGWSREAHGLRARAMDALRRIEQEAKSYYDSLRDGLSSGASNTRDFAAERASVISGFTSDLRSRFAAGLDNLPPEARERVIAARERAYGAMLQAERMGRDVLRDPTRAMEEHPLVAGAVGFALGAAVAAVLPSTEVENRTFGAERDRLMDEATRMLRQERERARQIAGSVGEEIKAAARETAQAVSHTVTDKAKETAQAVTDTVTDKAQQAADRVTDRATEEARTGQGSSGSLSGTSGTSGSGTAGSGMAGPGDPVIR